MTASLPEGYGAECAVFADCTGTAACEAPAACCQHLPGALGITYKQIDHWSRRGWLHPEGGTGIGTKRWWPAAEAEVARRMGLLTAAGVSVERAAAVARSDDWPRAEIAPGVIVEIPAESWASGLRRGAGSQREIGPAESEAARAHVIAKFGRIPESLQRIVDAGGRFGMPVPSSLRPKAAKP